MSSSPRIPALRSRLIAPAVRRGAGRRPVNPPIERASTILNDDPARLHDTTGGPGYGLEGMSAARALRELIADLEDAREAFIVPSGLAAVTVPLTALLRPGDEVLTSDAIYGPSRRFLTRHMAERGVTTRFHAADAGPEAVIAALSPATRVLLVESPASLTFEMLDITAVTQACRARGVLTIMDNTWAAGLAYRPLAHGVDVSAQALTKYVGGHADILMGSITVNDAEIGRAISETIVDVGWHVSPDDAWLALRGARSLPLRYAEQARSARVVADWLQAQPEIERVLWPALPGSIGHDIWRRDFTGAASLMGLVMKGGDAQAAYALMGALTRFGIGFSWGGFESLITYDTPQLAYRDMPPTLPGPLLRIHIGLEDPVDLIADLEIGMEAWRRAVADA